MIEFNKKLFLGLGGSSITTWDGFKFSDSVFIGNTPYSSVGVGPFLDINNELYFGGSFSYNNQRYHLAKMDTNENVEYLLSVVNGGISSILLFKNELYIAGNFDSIGGKPMNGVAKRVLITKAEEKNVPFSMQPPGFPNPAFHSFTVNIPEKNHDNSKVGFYIFDIRGRKMETVILSHNLNENGTSVTISTKNLKPGIYFYHTYLSGRNEKEKGVWGKVVVE